MNLKLDENLPYQLVRLLTDLGHDVDTVPDEHLAGRDDDVVWAAAQAAGRFLVTQDLDFSGRQEVRAWNTPRAAPGQAAAAWSERARRARVDVVSNGGRRGVERLRGVGDSQEGPRQASRVLEQGAVSDRRIYRALSEYPASDVQTRALPVSQSLHTGDLNKVNAAINAFLDSTADHSSCEKESAYGVALDGQGDPTFVSTDILETVGNGPKRHDFARAIREGQMESAASIIGLDQMHKCYAILRSLSIAVNA